MEPLMLRAVDAARKLRRPVREDYIPPVEKVQNLFVIDFPGVSKQKNRKNDSFIVFPKVLKENSETHFC